MPRLFSTILMGALMVSQTLWADTREERLAVAKEYIAATVDDLDFDKMIGNMWKPIVGQLAAGGQVLDQMQLDEIQNLYRGEFLEPLTELMLSQDEIMADVYTLDEIIAMRDFYSTEVGRAAMRKLPILLERQQPLVLELATQSIPKVMPKLQKIIEGK